MRNLHYIITTALLAGVIALSSIFSVTTVYASEAINTDMLMSTEQLPVFEDADSAGYTMDPTEKKYVVVLDPGHGRAGSGTYREYQNFVIDEAVINLKIAQYTKEALETNYKNVTVYMTKTTQNENPSLQERVIYATDKNADILVSQHVNATSEERTVANGVMAMVPTVDAAHSFNKGAAIFSQKLARNVLDELVVLGFKDNGFFYKLSGDNTLYEDGSLADYYGIIRLCRENNFPGTIIEHGFANNESDALMLNDEDMLKRIGEADARGIMEFLTNNPDMGVSVLSGWQKIDTEWYYYDEQGQLLSGWILDNNTWYYLNESGVMQTGWICDKGAWYYLDQFGAMQTGWVLDGNNWYYLDAGGVMQTGWIWYRNAWYYLDNAGIMQTGWICDKYAWYYLNADGIMQTGWILDGNNWYYLNAGGVMQTGWVLNGSNWYYLNNSGIMQTGWILDGNNWYYLNAGGVMQTGWVLDGGNWYYLNNSGIMQTGWQCIAGTWYYFYDSGIMATGMANINGIVYNFTASGAWIN